MIDLTQIQLHVAQTVGILVDLRSALPPSSSGENAELERCIGTLKSILEEIDAYESSRPIVTRPFNYPPEN